MNPNTITATFDHAIHHSVTFAFPSLFTKDDVIKVIRDLEFELQNAIKEEPTPTTVITKEQIKEIAEQAAASIVSEGMDLVDSYDLTMSYREVELDEISLDEGRLTYAIEQAITEWFEGV